MRRTLATIAITASLLGGSAVTASADTYRTLPVRTVAFHKVTGLDLCKAALTRADRNRKSERLADHAVAVCGKHIDTRREANALYRWSKGQSAYIRDLIG
jgi:hypothetical protein